MRQFFKFLFASLCAIILFNLILFIIVLGVAAGSSSSKDKVVEKNSVLLIDLNEPIMEQGKENTLAVLSNQSSTTLGLNDVLLSIENAKTDTKINGIYIKMGICPNGWASMQELRLALIDFQKTDKFVIAYGEVADHKSYYVASACKKVYLNPAGGMDYKGLAINGMFYKGTLDKLDIKTEAFHCGQYKGAYEPYKLEKYSDPNRYQLGVLLGDFYAEFLRGVSEKTGTDTTTLATMARNGSVRFPKDALEAKLVDGLLFSDSVDNIVKQKMNLKAKDKINFITPDEYAASIPSPSKSKDKIAVLYADGTIYDGEGDEDIHSKDYIKVIRKLANDESIKALVLRINSPGGSAMASEIIYHELMELKKKKPIVVSMSNYAASGGYYIACAADSIFADQNTLTGSIGVVGVMFNIGDMLKNKLGVTTDVVKTGPFADFPNMSRPMTDLERTWIQSYLDSTYIQFKSRVALARQMTMAQVEDLAQGHVYSGVSAKKINLIDDFGNMKRALQSASALAKLSSYKTVEYPKQVDKLEEIISKLTGQKREEAVVKKVLGEDYVVYKEIQKLRSQQNQLQTIMPMQFDIK